MALSSISLLAYLLLLFIIYFFSKCYAYEGRATIEKYNLQQSHVFVEVTSLLPSSVCTPSTKGTPNKKSSVKLVHKHGPCSSLNQGNSNVSLNLTQIIFQDLSRVDSIHHMLSNSGRDKFYDLAVSVPVKPGSVVNSGNYIVTVGLGTPKKDLSLIFDTGSGLTWTQCEPCIKYCHKQKDPIFGPSKSTSYSNISCNSALCSQLESTTGVKPSCSASTCVYGIQYGDQSFSVGYFGKERLTLGSTKEVFDNFYFGCGQNNQGLFGGAAGLLGLARDELSFVSQTAQKYEQFFSYCLPSKVSTPGYLTFGKRGRFLNDVKFTPLVVNSQYAFYFMTILGISVGGTNLSIPPSVFTNSGSIIDSGTVITRLPPTAYASLRSTFRKMMSNYKSALPVSILDTCFDLSRYKSVAIPKVSFFFDGGVEMVLDRSGILYTVSKAQVCLAFAGNSDDSEVAIFGNSQQQTFDVVYDVAGGRLGFGPGGCN